MSGVPADAIGYFFNDGGLTNQKLALLGLFAEAGRTGNRLVMPNLASLDVATNRLEVLPAGRVFDQAALAAFAASHWIEILPFSAAVMDDPDRRRRNGWDYFDKGCVLRDEWLQGRPEAGFAGEWLAALRPHVQGSFVLEILRRAIYDQCGAQAVLQLRIEADWQRFCATTPPTDDLSEPVLLSGPEIVAKAKARLPDLRAAYVACDDAALTVNKESLRAACKAESDVALWFKTDFIRRFEWDRLSTLDRATIDFELAVEAPAFVGNSRSTFANMVSAERFCRTGTPPDAHYIYNTHDPAAVLRHDRGLHAEPALATAAPVA